ncbi:MAG TPA: hypothetical protein H9857_08175 [Candidatus Desulfovibrio intestinigallinarum]|nr:hypothetical protein [Candidatus Desulfovibrio intestinigallinarum]
MVVFGARKENSPEGGFHASPAQAAPFRAAALPPERRTASRAAFMRRGLEQFQFEMLRIPNHTACRFAEKARFFPLTSGRAALCRRLAFHLFQG